MKPSIFVQIASYRDPECQWTVKDMFEKAANPERIFAGICWQYDHHYDNDCFKIPSPRPEQTREVHVRSKDTEGVCWARALAQEMYGGEDYILMIDSHMRFIKGWDDALIEELSLCPSEKPVISCYPPGYVPPDEIDESPIPSIVAAKQFDERGDIRFNSMTYTNWPLQPLRGAFIAAGFLFAPGKLVREVPYDPHMYFNQEEITLSARMYTNGFDIFAPTRVFLYHYYNIREEDKKQRKTHWGDRKDWNNFQLKGRSRFHHMLCGRQTNNESALVEMDKYTLGNARTLSEFEKFTGIDFANLKASDNSLKAIFNPPSLKTGDAFPRLLLRDHKGAVKDIARYAGLPTLLCYMPVSFDDYCRDFINLLKEKIAELHGKLYLLMVIRGNPTDAERFRTKFEVPQSVLADEFAEISSLIGNELTAKVEPCTILLDTHLKVAGKCTERNAANHFAEMLRNAKSLQTK